MNVSKVYIHNSLSTTLHMDFLRARARVMARVGLELGVWPR